MVRRSMLKLRLGGGPNSSCISAARCSTLSLFCSSHADASVIAAPNPTIRWYRCVGSTSITSVAADFDPESKGRLR